MNDIKNIAEALKDGDIEKASRIKKNISSSDEATEYEVCEVVRQAIIVFLKKKEVYNAREAERLFSLPKELVDETIKQAILSIFRDGDIKTVAELKNDLPISPVMAREIIEYCASWGKDGYIEELSVVFA